MDYSRQMEIYRPEEHDKQPVHIIGCGALGSWTAVLLAKLGVRDITLWDNDIVEEHNLPNQLFTLKQIGKNKAEALADMIEWMTGARPTVRSRRCTASDTLPGVVLCCVDSMKGRSALFDAFCMTPRGRLWVEGRMGLREGLLYTVDPSDAAQVMAYKTTLYSDDVSEASACGISQAVGATAAHIASLAVWKYVRYAIGYREQARANETMIDLKDGVYLENVWGKKAVV